MLLNQVNIKDCKMDIRESKVLPPVVLNLCVNFTFTRCWHFIYGSKHYKERRRNQIMAQSAIFVSLKFLLITCLNKSSLTYGFIKDNPKYQSLKIRMDILNGKN